jgi:chromosome segregation ATPase
MSTQPSSDLDRTDQLPVLDVEAYEASLAEGQKALGRTDTWAVSALQDMDELAEATRKERRPAHRNLPRPKAAELTANVERILHRIAELEAEITAAHEANAALQKRSKAIESERDQQLQRVRALEAESARLGEHRVLAESKVDSLERQLDEQAHRAKLEIEDLRSLHRAEAERRAEDVATLEKAVTDEKASNARLAQQLAAKLKDCERLAVVVDDNLRESQSLLQEREGIIAQRDQQIAAIEGELRGVVDELESERQRLSAAMTAIAAAEPQRVEMEERVQELTAQ